MSGPWIEALRALDALYIWAPPGSFLAGAATLALGLLRRRLPLAAWTSPSWIFGGLGVWAASRALAQARDTPDLSTGAAALALQGVFEGLSVYAHVAGWLLLLSACVLGLTGLRDLRGSTRLRFGAGLLPLILVGCAWPLAELPEWFRHEEVQPPTLMGLWPWLPSTAPAA